MRHAILFYKKCLQLPVFALWKGSQMGVDNQTQGNEINMCYHLDDHGYIIVDELSLNGFKQVHELMCSLYNN